MKRKQLLQCAIAVKALKFGEFTLKSGRKSPYFFNAAAFDSGAALRILTSAYAQQIAQLLAEGVTIELLFAPAYKGIPLVAGVAVLLEVEHGISLPWAFDRKEAKQHGEGGVLVGAPVKDRAVLVLDDVLTAGTAIRHSLSLLRANGAHPRALLVALDRCEKLENSSLSALQSVAKDENLIANALLTFDDLLSYVTTDAQYQDFLPALRNYRQLYASV